VSPKSLQTKSRTPSPAFELWSWHKGTVDRIGDSWLDQNPRSRDDTRVKDLALLELGDRKLRYPAQLQRILATDREERDLRGAVGLLASACVLAKLSQGTKVPVA
jgi:hypothetical protein